MLNHGLLAVLAADAMAKLRERRANRQRESGGDPVALVRSDARAQLAAKGRYGFYLCALALVLMNLCGPCRCRQAQPTRYPFC
jgi:hypothetical protein